MSAVEYKNKGNEFFKVGKYEDAIVWYSKAVDADPSNETLYSNRAASYSAVNKHQEALVDAEKCVQLKPTWVKGHFRKGIAMCRMGRYDEAVAAYAKSLEIEPSNKDIQAKYNEARSLMKKEAESKSASKVTDPAECKKLGNTLFKDGNYEDAIGWYSRAIELSEANGGDDVAVYYTNRAACYAQTHAYKSVIGDATTAISINPKYSKAYMRRAMAYDGLEKWQKAADDYKMVMQLEPGAANASEAYRRSSKFAKEM